MAQQKQQKGVDCLPQCIDLSKAHSIYFIHVCSYENQSVYRTATQKNGSRFVKAIYFGGTRELIVYVMDDNNNKQLS
jgi:hypothetical protein